MKLVLTYSDGTIFEHEVDNVSVIAVDAPARNADGSLVAGRFPMTFPVYEQLGSGPEYEIRKLVDLAIVEA